MMGIAILSEIWASEDVGRYRLSTGGFRPTPAIRQDIFAGRYNKHIQVLSNCTTHPHRRQQMYNVVQMCSRIVQVH